VSKLVLFGTGRGADVAYRFLAADSDHEIMAFTVDEAIAAFRSLRSRKCSIAILPTASECSSCSGINR
jgi:hypothetical protein